MGACRAELRRRRQLPTAIRASSGQRRCTFLAEYGAHLVFVLAPGALHPRLHEAGGPLGTATIARAWQRVNEHIPASVRCFAVRCFGYIRVTRISDRWVETPMEVVTTRFCTVAWVARDPSTVGYESFSNRSWSQRATNNASWNRASHVSGFGSLWLSLRATSWVVPG